jgi:distribution and morphology protein 31
MSNAAFILVGTTTFASLLLALANSLQFQEFIARRVGEYLTYETGVKFVFDSAIVPNWRDGKIRLRNVVLSRGPQQRSITTTDNNNNNNNNSETIHQKTTTLAKINDEKSSSMLGSNSTELISTITDETSTHVSSLDRETSYGIVVASPLEEKEQETTLDDTVLDTNLTMFHLTVDQVEVTLNMMRWFDGKYKHLL